MSTSEGGGYPDLTVLAQIANELFRALPGGPPSTPPSAPTWTPVSGTPSPAGAGSAPVFAGAPSTVAPGISGAALPTVPGVPSIPGITGISLPAVGGSPSLPGTSGAALQGLTAPAVADTPGAAAPGDLLYFLSHARTATPAAAAPGTPATAARTPGHSGAQDAGAPSLTTRSGAFDAASVRRDFPILEQRVHGDKPLIWLDNAATTQKPRAVIDRLAAFYAEENSNIHRAAHALAARATDAYEGAREKVRRFLNAPRKEDIVFTRGATEAINLVAQSWGRRNIGPGDEIVISWLEHHSNIVPWQMLCAEKGARLRVAPVDDDGQVILEEYDKLLSRRTRLVSITHVSNALGTVLPVEIMTRAAHRHGALVLVDGAQAVSHMPVDVQAIDCDFYVFSGHKVFGPTGIGALFGKSEVLETAPPWQGGGNMIVDVTFEKTVYATAPARFEAGTGNIADAVGLGAAIDYVQEIGMPTIAQYEHDLLVYATDALTAIPGLRPIGTADEKAGVISFVLDGFRPEEVGAALDRDGIAVRSGHHCAQPALRRFGLEQSVRPSLALYNTCEDIDALVASIRKLQRERGMR